MPWASGNYRYQRYLISDGHSFRAEVWRETTGGRPYVFTRDGGCTYYEDNLDNDDPVEIDELAPQVGAGVDVNAPRTSSRWTLFPSSFTPIRTGTVHVGKPVTVETLPK
ncbi:hypothetical protein [Jiangella gansuensis]|uniref:hypothetical protein n=1 Tax=Jiangella gansuensis TaxID=281473 RepID=UPI00047DF70F|nr:hypothetical protein [Jiangella gansuensis]